MNKFLLMPVFCLISNVACPMASIKLDEASKAILVAYALSKSSQDHYWPQDARVSLESFRFVNESMYEARFFGRYNEFKYVDGRPYILNMCHPRTAEILATTLKNLGVNLPEQKD